MEEFQEQYGAGMNSGAQDIRSDARKVCISQDACTHQKKSFILTSRVRLVVSVSASHAVGHRFGPSLDHTKDHHKNGRNCLPASMHALGLEFDSTARLYKRSDSVRNCLWRHVLKRSPGINGKSRVLYPSPRFLSIATWP